MGLILWSDFSVIWNVTKRTLEAAKSGLYINF